MCPQDGRWDRDGRAPHPTGNGGWQRNRFLLQEVGVYEYTHPLEDAVAYKAPLESITAQYKSLAKGDEAISSICWQVNGSAAAGRKMIRECSKLMLRAYNADADNLVRTMRPYKLAAAVDRLQKARETITRLGSTMDMRITDASHRLRVQELQLAADYKARTEEEKERIREQRALEVVTGAPSIEGSTLSSSLVLWQSRSHLNESSRMEPDSIPSRQSRDQKIDNRFEAPVQTVVQAQTIGHMSLNVTTEARDHWTDYWHPDTIASGIVGREGDLERLRQGLEDGGTAARVQSISGFGGIGKTKLAVAYANTHRDRYPDGRVFYDFQSYTSERAPHTADQALLQILPTVSERLSVVDVERLSVEGRLSAWKECVAGRRLLMIWDNIKRVEQVEGLLLRDQSGCATIITSRDDIDLGDAAMPLTLDVLDREAGRTLFRQIAGEGHPAQQVDALLDADLHIPVLIEFHARQIKFGERTAHEIIADLDSAPLDPDMDPRQRLFDRFDGSYAHLNTDQQFALRVFGAHPGQFATAASLAAALGCSPTEANKLMDGLGRAGFVRRHFHRSGDVDPLLRAYSSHDSFRAYAAHQAHRERDYFPAQDELALYYLARLQEDVKNGRPWLDVELDNVRDTALAGKKLHHAELSNSAGEYAFLLNRYNDADAVYRHASNVFRSTGDRIGYARALLGLAEVARARNEYAVATECFEEAGGIYQAADNRSGYALAAQGLGHIARALGDLGAAAAHFESAAALFEEDGNRDGCAHALWGLGDVARLRGEHGTAAGHFEAAAKIYEGENNQRGYAHSLQGLGHIARERGELEKAVSYYERAAEIYRAIQHDQGFAFALQGMGDVALARGEYELAFQRYKPAAAIYRSVGNRTGLAEVLLSLASMEETRGVTAGAQQYLSDALALYDQIGLTDEAACVRHRLSRFGNASTEAQPDEAPPRST